MTDSSNFYVAGGTLSNDARSYVYRKADEELYQALLRGEYCYILTARQMGKSSIMVRTSARLRANGLAVALLDLTALGQNVSPEQWYGGLLMQMGSRFDLEDELMAFWERQPSLGPLQRWIRSIREIVLGRCSPAPVVIFIDEIDVVCSLPFSADEFFAGIRECYNERSQYHEMERLSFCLIGVAAPTDLVRDVRLTPFNIGRRIELHDFTADEAASLARGLEGGHGRGAALLARVLYWTGGQPFLTQRTCLEIAKREDIRRPKQVDSLCADMYFSHRAQERDDNLLFVRERMLRDTGDPAAVLDVYGQIRKGRIVQDDETDPVVSTLRLSGITRAERGRLRVRNRIYRRVFNQDWVRTAMPRAELLRQRAAYRRGLRRAALISSLVLLIVSSFALVAITQRKRFQQEAERNRRLLYDAELRLAQDAWDHADTGRVRELLTASRGKRGQDDLRGFEWYLLQQFANRDLWHTSGDYPIVAATFSPDEKALCIGESLRGQNGPDEYLLKLYDLESQKDLQSFRVFTDAAFAQVVFSPDCRHALLSGSDHRVMVLNLNTGKPIAELTGHKDRLSAVALAADGKTLSTGDMTGVIKLWRFEQGRMLPRTLGKQANWPRSIALSPDGSILAVADESLHVRLVDTRGPRELAPINSQEGPVVYVAFSPSGGQLLTATKNGNLQIWNLKTSQITAILSGHSGQVGTAAFSPDGKMLATGSWDRTVRIWSTTSGQELETIKGHGAAVLSVSWSPDGKRLITGGGDNKVNIWSVASTNGPPRLPEKVKAFMATTFSPAGELLALGLTQNNQVELWNLSRGLRLVRLNEPGRNLMCASFSRDGSLLATGGLNNVVKLWETATGEEVRSLDGHYRSVYAIAFSPDGRLLVSGGYDRTLRLWDTVGGQEVAQLKGEAQNSWIAVFSPNGKNLASGFRDGSVALWDVATRHIVHMFRGHENNIKALAFSPDGQRLASGSNDHTLRLWDVVNGKPLQTLGMTDVVQRIAFSPDGRRLLTGGSEGAVKIWDLVTSQELITLPGHTDEVTSITFSEDGRSLATSGADGIVRLWSTKVDAQDRHGREN